MRNSKIFLKKKRFSIIQVIIIIFFLKSKNFAHLNYGHDIYPCFHFNIVSLDFLLNSLMYARIAYLMTSKSKNLL